MNVAGEKKGKNHEPTDSKHTTILPVVIALVLSCFALAPVTDAQCPQICDSNENTALGISALSFNTTGTDNTAIGFRAAYYNGTGGNNTVVGANAAFNNQSGSNNCAFGSSALEGTTDEGSNNTAIGTNALLSSSGGGNNVAIGYNAGVQSISGNNNVFIGAFAGANVQGLGSNNIDIGNEGGPGESNHIWIGKKGVQRIVHIAGIYNSTVTNGVAVMTDNLGHLGTVTSSARFKDNIQPMDKASEAILALKPVTFRYKHELDPAGIPQFGLVAEDVEKVNPDLVARDDQGKPYTVRYEAVNAMLLNEFLKEHRTVQEQKTIIAELKRNFAEQQKQIQQLTAGLQKVSAQLELSKSAPQTVLNNQ